MTKSQLIYNISARLGKDHREVRLILEAIIDEINSSLMRLDKIQFVKWGVIKVGILGPRKVRRRIKEGSGDEPVMSLGRRVKVKFYPCTQLQEKLNSLVAQDTEEPVDLNSSDYYN